jgi:hypothetical protein
MLVYQRVNIASIPCCLRIELIEASEKIKR